MDKLDELKILSDEQKPELICCVETWLDKSHSLKEIEIKDYKCLNRLRSNKPNRGGVCIYYKKGINIEEIDMPRHNKPCKCETIWARIADNTGKKAIIALTYRSPMNDNFMDHIEEDLNYAAQLNLPIILLGDLNYDLLKDTPCKRKLTYLFDRQCMVQMIDKATRITKESQTLIDHLWTSDNDFIKDVEILPGLSDHQLCKFKLELEHQPLKKEKFKFRKITKNIENIVQELHSYDWDTMIETNDSNTAWKNYVID